MGSLNNPFQKWVEKIYVESQSFLQTGNNINPLYLPELVPYIIKCMKLVPLWSGIMIPIFGYGNETASSAAVESSFQKLKNVTFKNISLPTDIELFLEHHISSLSGMSLLKSSRSLLPKDTTVNNNNEIQSNQHSSPVYEESSPAYANSHSNKDKSPPIEECDLSRGSSPTYLYSYSNVENSPPPREIDLNTDTSLTNMDSDSIIECLNTSQLEHLSDIKMTPEKNNYEKEIDNCIESLSTNFNTVKNNKKKCPLCAVGDFPKDKSHKCSICKVPVHTLSSCSLTKPGQSGITTICLSCSHDVLFVDDLIEENKCIESWNKKSTKKKESTVLLKPQSSS